MPRPHAESQKAIRAWLDARDVGDAAAEATARAAMVAANRRADAVRAEAQGGAPGGRSARQDEGLRLRVHHLHPDHLPHGVIGLLIAVLFAAALSSKAAELNALGTTTTIDF